MQRQPVLATIGVNPDILQFYVSKIDGKWNPLVGSFHRLYISGILSNFSLLAPLPHISLTVPQMQEQSRNLIFALPNPLSARDANAANLAQFAYVAEIDPLPVISHRFDCIPFPPRLSVDSVVETESLMLRQWRNHWILPWSRTLYKQWAFWGVSGDEIDSFLTAAKHGLEEFRGNSVLFPAFSNLSESGCILESVRFTGLFSSECPFHSEDETPFSRSSCQLSLHSVSLLFSIFPFCRIRTVSLVGPFPSLF